MKSSVSTARTASSVFVGAGIAHHADALHRQQHGEHLRRLPIQAGCLISSTTIASASRSISSRCWSSAPGSAPPARARGTDAARRFLPAARVAAQPADFVLEQIAQRLDQLEAQILRQPADVVMQLDRGRRTIGARRRFRSRRDTAFPAPETRRLRILRRFVCEALDEHMADPPSLLLRIDDAGQRRQKSIFGFDDVQIGFEVMRELADHRPLLRPCATGRCRPRCTTPAGRSPRPTAPRRPTNRRRRTARRSRVRLPTRSRMPLDRLVGKIANLPRAAAAANVLEKVGQNRCPGGVCVTSG